MKIGQIVKVKPHELDQKVEAVTVYVHPQGRYFVAEFTGSNGEKLRESFYLGSKAISVKAEYYQSKNYVSCWM